MALSVCARVLSVVDARVWTIRSKPLEAFATNATRPPSGESAQPRPCAADGHALWGAPPFTETASRPPSRGKKNVRPSLLQKPPPPLCPSGYVVNATGGPLPSAGAAHTLLTPPSSYVNQTWLPSGVHWCPDGCLI